jgi:hypothetical protein
LKEEQKFNTHVIGEAKFLCCTYILFVVRHASPLDRQREKEVELGEMRRREGGREREGGKERVRVRLKTRRERMRLSVRGRGEIKGRGAREI